MDLKRERQAEKCEAPKAGEAGVGEDAAFVARVPSNSFRGSVCKGKLENGCLQGNPIMFKRTTRGTPPTNFVGLKTGGPQIDGFPPGSPRGYRALNRHANCLLQALAFWCTVRLWRGLESRGRRREISNWWTKKDQT